MRILITLYPALANLDPTGYRATFHDIENVDIRMVPTSEAPCVARALRPEDGWTEVRKLDGRYYRPCSDHVEEIRRRFHNSGLRLDFDCDGPGTLVVRNLAAIAQAAASIVDRCLYLEDGYFWIECGAPVVEACMRVVLGEDNLQSHVRISSRAVLRLTTLDSDAFQHSSVFFPLNALSEAFTFVETFAGGVPVEVDDFSVVNSADACTWTDCLFKLTQRLSPSERAMAGRPLDTGDPRVVAEVLRDLPYLDADSQGRCTRIAWMALAADRLDAEHPRTPLRVEDGKVGVDVPFAYSANLRINRTHRGHRRLVVDEIPLSVALRTEPVPVVASVSAYESRPPRMFGAVDDGFAEWVSGSRLREKIACGWERAPTPPAFETPSASIKGPTPVLASELAGRYPCVADDRKEWVAALEARADAMFIRGYDAWRICGEPVVEIRRDNYDTGGWRVVVVPSDEVQDWGRALPLAAVAEAERVAWSLGRQIGRPGVTLYDASPLRLSRGDILGKFVLRDPVLSKLPLIGSDYLVEEALAGALSKTLSSVDAACRKRIDFALRCWNASAGVEATREADAEAIAAGFSAH